MEARPTEAEGRQSLREHILDKAAAARQRYAGPEGLDVPALLADRALVRYPVAVDFDGSPLRPGEFAFLEALGGHPTDGFRLHLHPSLLSRPEAWPLAIAYYLPSVNYGEIAGHEEAELFGATLLGTSVDAYYAALCRLADGT